MTDKQPHINDVSNIELVIEDDDHLIIRLLSRRGWVSCRIKAELFEAALEQLEADTQRLVDEQLRQLRGSP